MAAYLLRERASFSMWRALGPILVGSFTYGVRAEILHRVGLHTFTDCWEEGDGYRQFRGSRCAICDDPWSPA